MDDQPSQNQTPQSTPLIPAEPPVPAIVAPAIVAPQNEAIAEPVATNTALENQTPHSEPSPEVPLQTAIVKPKEIEVASEPKPATPQTVEPAQPSKPMPVQDKAKRARAAIQFKKRQKLDQILAEVSAKGSISNNEVEKMLGVSDATASRYLVALQKEGRLKRIGSTGKAVRYKIQ